VFVLVALFAADETFVQFDDASQLVKVIARAARLAQTLQHEPSGLLGNTDLFAELQAGDALACGYEQVHRIEPLVKGNVAALEDRACADREIQLAGVAAIEANLWLLADAFTAFALRAERAVRPEARFQIKPRRLSGREHLEKLECADCALTHVICLPLRRANIRSHQGRDSKLPLGCVHISWLAHHKCGNYHRQAGLLSHLPAHHGVEDQAALSLRPVPGCHRNPSRLPALPSTNRARHRHILSRELNRGQAVRILCSMLTSQTLADCRHSKEPRCHLFAAGNRDSDKAYTQGRSSSVIPFKLGNFLTRSKQSEAPHLCQVPFDSLTLPHLGLQVDPALGCNGFNQAHRVAGKERGNVGVGFGCVAWLSSHPLRSHRFIRTRRLVEGAPTIGARKIVFHLAASRTVTIVDNSLRFVKNFSRFVLKGLATHVYNSLCFPVPRYHSLLFGLGWYLGSRAHPPIWQLCGLTRLGCECAPSLHLSRSFHLGEASMARRPSLKAFCCASPNGVKGLSSRRHGL